MEPDRREPVSLPRLCQAFSDILNLLIFDVASYRGLTDAEIHRQSPGWLFSQYDLTQRARWREWTGMVAGTESALNRVAYSLTKKKGAAPVKPLPTYDEVVKQAAEKEPEQRARNRSSEFTERIEKANQIGRYARDITNVDHDRNDPVQDPG